MELDTTTVDALNIQSAISNRMDPIKDEIETTKAPSRRNVDNIISHIEEGIVYKKGPAPLRRWQKRHLRFPSEHYNIGLLSLRLVHRKNIHQSQDKARFEYINRLLFEAMSAATVNAQNILVYYKTKDLRELPQGLIYLAHITAVDVISSKRSYEFRIRTLSRDYTFATRTASEADTWVLAIKQRIQTSFLDVRTSPAYLQSYQQLVEGTGFISKTEVQDLDGEEEEDVFSGSEMTFPTKKEDHGVGFNLIKSPQLLVSMDRVSLTKGSISKVQSAPTFSPTFIKRKPTTRTIKNIFRKNTRNSKNRFGPGIDSKSFRAGEGASQAFVSAEPSDENNKDELSQPTISPDSTWSKLYDASIISFAASLNAATEFQAPELDNEPNQVTIDEEISREVAESDSEEKQIEETGSVKKNSEKIEPVQKDSEEIESVQKDSEEIESVQKDSEEIESVQKDSEEIESVQKDSEEIESVQKEPGEATIESESTQDKDIESAVTDALQDELDDQVTKSEITNQGDAQYDVVNVDIKALAGQSSEEVLPTVSQVDDQNEPGPSITKSDDQKIEVGNDVPTEEKDEDVDVEDEAVPDVTVTSASSDEADIDSSSKVEEVKEETKFDADPSEVKDLSLEKETDVVNENNNAVEHEDATTEASEIEITAAEASESEKKSKSSSSIKSLDKSSEAPETTVENPIEQEDPIEVESSHDIEAEVNESDTNEVKSTEEATASPSVNSNQDEETKNTDIKIVVPSTDLPLNANEPTSPQPPNSPNDLEKPQILSPAPLPELEIVESNLDNTDEVVTSTSKDQTAEVSDSHPTLSKPKSNRNVTFDASEPKEIALEQPIYSQESVISSESHPTSPTTKRLSGLRSLMSPYAYTQLHPETSAQDEIHLHYVELEKKAVYSNFIYKQSSLLHSSNLRYAILFSNGTLTYYRSASSVSDGKSIPLDASCVTRLLDNNKIAITTPTNSYLFQAQSEEEKLAWYQAFTKFTCPSPSV